MGAEHSRAWSVDSAEEDIMNNLLLFIVGFLVSSVVMLAIGILVYAAILDGRYEREQQDVRASESS